MTGNWVPTSPWAGLAVKKWKGCVGETRIFGELHIQGSQTDGTAAKELPGAPN